MGEWNIELKTHNNEEGNIKQCTDCKRILPETEFSKRKDSRNKENSLQSKCKKCMSKRASEIAKKRKEELETLRKENKELKETISKLQGE